MSGWLWFTLGAFAAGPFVGLALFLLLGEGAHRRGVLAGQAQAELAHGWHPAPVERRRGDDLWARVDRQITVSPPHPVAHRDS